MGNNIIEEDMLISLKMLAIKRTRLIGHEELAEKFYLKMLHEELAILFLFYNIPIESFVFYNNPIEKFFQVQNFH